MSSSLPTLNHLAIAGPGLMGLGIARLAARAGVHVLLLGRDTTATQAARERLNTALQRGAAKGHISNAQYEAMMSLIHIAPNPSALADCQLLIECVPEDRVLKTTLLAQLQTALPPSALLASNTSGLPISALAAGLPAAPRFLGLHFFSPVPSMPLVEVVRGTATDDATLALAIHWMRQLGQHPITVRDGPGFFTSRVFAAYLDEAVALVGEGVDVTAIDAAGLALGRAIGPLALLDDIGLRLNLQQAHQARADGLPARFCRPLAEPVLRLLVSAGRAGRRDGGGFYDLQPDRTRTPWPGLSPHFKRQSPQPDAAYIQQRLRWVEVLEALRCLEEGVIASADDADTASRLGLGFPKADGGLLRWVEAFGLARGMSLCEALARAHGGRFAPSPWMRQRSQHPHGLAAFRSTPSVPGTQP